MGFPVASAADAVTTVMRYWLCAAGMPASEAALYSCHSLRHGGATDMLDSGIASELVAKQGRWLSLVWFTTYRHITQLSARSLLKLGTDPLDGLAFL